MNRLVGDDPKDSWPNEDLWLELVNQLRVRVWNSVKDTKIHPEPHAQDAQGYCCEFDKYERTRLGEGTPRSKYEVPS